jgi:integrase/recombinase XerD
MEKKFLPKSRPPRLYKGKRGNWLIEWWETHPVTGELERFRKTFQLNRIKKKSIRKIEAERIMAAIHLELHKGGYVYRNEAQVAGPDGYLGDVMERALKGKLLRARRDTINSYNSVLHIFMEWCVAKKLKHRPPGHLTTARALEFLDYCRDVRGVGARSYNNYRTILGSLFSYSKRRGWVESNPWEEVPRLRAPEKQRREFTLAEMKAVGSYCRDNNPGLYMAILLLYYCFIRPTELRGLRVKDFDLRSQIIHIRSQVNKNRKNQTVTIPDILVSTLQDYLIGHPDYALVFGPKLKPHKSRSCSKNVFNYQHRKVLEKLRDLRQIGDITGLSFYSWKDTGIADSAQESSLLDVMKQARHSDPSITMVYMNKARPNENMKKVKGKLLDE